MGVGAGLYVYDVVIKKFTFAISHRRVYTLDRCNPWAHVANRHISISQLLSSCCYLFAFCNSGLLSMQRPRKANHEHFRHSHIPELICGFNSSIDWQSAVDSVFS